jgi:tetratricopeptide (TPR) repeat protein
VAVSASGHVAHALGLFEPDIEPAITLINRALDLNPSFAFGWFIKGWLRLWAGQADVAIELFEKSLRLDPLRKTHANADPADNHAWLDVTRTHDPSGGKRLRARG